MNEIFITIIWDRSHLFDDFSEYSIVLADNI